MARALRGGHGRLGGAPAGVLALALAAQAAMMVTIARHLWFYRDDWSFLLGRSLTHHTLDALLEPHNEHWSTVPVVAFRLLYSVFGLGHYLPYALMPIAAHVAICALLYLLLRRSEVPGWPACLATVVVAWLAGGTGAQNPLWPFQIGMLGSGLFGMLALVLLCGHGRTRRWTCIVALVLGLMCSGIGLLMVAWAGLLALFRHGLRDAVLTCIVPLVVYLLWYGAFGRDYAGTSPDLALAPFAATGGLASVWTGALRMDGAGPAALVAMAAAVIVPRHARPVFAVAASGLATLVLAFAVFGFSRSGLGIDSTLASRYAYFGVLFSGAPVAAGLAAAARRLRPVPWSDVVGFAFVAGLAVALGAAELHAVGVSRRVAVSMTKGRVLAAHQLVGSGAVLLRDEPDPVNPDITMSRLSRPGVGSSLPRIRVSAEDRLAARSALQVDVRGTPFSLPAAEEVAWHGFDGVPPSWQRLDGCVTKRSTVPAALDFRSPGSAAQVRVQTTGAGLRTRLVDRGLSSPDFPWPAPAGSLSFVATSADGMRVRVFVPAGTTTVCRPTDPQGVQPSG